MTQRSIRLCEDAFSLAVYRAESLPRWRLFARWKANREVSITFAMMQMAVEEQNR